LERREQTRYGLRADVDFEWKDEQGVSRRGRGLTRDISPKGMFIYSASQLPTKADVQVEVSLHSIAQAVTNFKMTAEALVIRVEASTSPGMHHGFAVLNRSCKLHNGSPIED
jgi:c-di-GMP-binding flagellar brake protein YcgR